MQKYKLINIDCASCAAKIENNLTKLKDVRYVSVNFAESVMFIDTDNIEKVRKVIKQTEPEVEIIDASQKVKGVKLEAEERLQLKKRLAFVLALAIVYLVGLIFGNYLSKAMHGTGETLLMAAIYLLAGWDVLYSAGKKILKGKLFDEHFLMSIATLGAVAIGQFPEAAGVMIFYQAGEFLQQLSVKRSRRSIKSLLEIQPGYANVRLDGELRRKNPKEVQPGEIILVKPGEKIPLDGIVTEGSGYVDTSPLTGEPVPGRVMPGKGVLAGMISKTGSFSLRVTKPFEESSIYRMLELIENASSQKAGTEKFITKFSRYYTPFVVAVAMLIAFTPPLLFGGSLDVWIYRALVILVISCPCALVISIPLAYFAAIGGASKKGILIKGSNFLDTLTEVKTVIFDKTGTLTKGVFKVKEIVPEDGYSKDDLLRLASAAAQQSNHPVSQSIREAYGKDPELKAVESYREIPGYGIKARVEGKEILSGSDRLLHKENIEHGSCGSSDTVLHVAFEGSYAGRIEISDELKDDAPDAVRYIRNEGVEQVLMFTGDNRVAAEKISKDLSLDGFHADLLPEDKVRVLESLENKSGKIAFIGDGINDAPALARSDVGIAMGALGSDLAIETADVVIMTDTPSKIGTAIRLAKRTRVIVWQNIIFALCVKAFFILLGSFGIATMWEAVFGDMGVALIAILNSTRVLK
ncbi:MAG: cadmium-translocating P-type ATPase [Ignavibacteria bacterium]|jgi:Cd2+/Zn2+-exporting ATPase|nr:cadmium-translocating P-type ATPase [Ignavibacteria bacterium]MCU7503509.1 cadmium-translocating P-type ATPase [Ignavibacteria bacterium]MCU7517255.1 cadmium-translocating P-type ATPase [Ignavibacteria bacterium]